MSYTLYNTYLADLNFMKILVPEIIEILKSCNRIEPLPAGANTITGIGLEYATEALATDVISLTLEGYIQYIYYQAYGEYYPVSPSPAEIDKIYAIYDALQISRPIL